MREKIGLYAAALLIAAFVFSAPCIAGEKKEAPEKPPTTVELVDKQLVAARARHNKIVEAINFTQARLDLLKNEYQKVLGEMAGLENFKKSLAEPEKKEENKKA